ncbi:Panacea domain-containing protein [Hymenobacter ruber]
MTSSEAAKYIIAFSDSKGDLITNKKLQKLLYYVQAWNLAVFNNPLFNDEPQAWRHGPVYPTVYQAFKKHGAEPVSLKDEYERDALDADDMMKLISRDNNLTLEKQGLIEEVMTKYGTQSAFSLEILSHRERPWLDAREGLDDFDRCDKVITHEAMRQYYSSLRKKKQEA